MRGTIFGKRKWIGLWLTVLSIIGYSLIAKIMEVDNETAGRVIWGVVSVYGVYVTGNSISKFRSVTYANKASYNNDTTRGESDGSNRP